MVTRIHTPLKVKKNLGQYAGEWIVFVNDIIVAHDKELTQAMSEVEKKGLQNKASVFLVPRKDEGPYALAVL